MMNQVSKLLLSMLPLNFAFPKAKLLLLLAYSLPVILLFWFVVTYSVSVPVSDEWTLIGFFRKIQSGTVNFGDFFAQDNEHRPFFPRIIYAIMAFSSKWDIKLENYFSLLLALVNFLLLYKISISTINESNRALFHLFGIATCIIFFSLIQNENWLLGFNLTFFLTITCAISAIFILDFCKNFPPITQIVLASLCCFINSFSNASGLLSWLAILPSLYLVKGEPKQKKIRFFIWILLFILCGFIYSIGYQKPPQTPHILFIFQQPLITLEYFFTIIGSPFCQHIFPPVITGLIIFLAFSLFNIFYFKNYRSDFATKATPWLSLSWFSILFALVTTIGRAGFGVEQATSSRYTTYLVLLIISCLQMWRLWILDKWQDDKKILSFWFVKLCLGFLIALFIFDSSSSISVGKYTFIYRNAAKDCLEIINFIQYKGYSPNDLLNNLMPDQPTILILSKALETLGFRHFPKKITFISNPDKPYGDIDIPTTTPQILTLPKSDTLKLSGWAIFPNQEEQPTAVLLSYGSNKSFIANGLVNSSRPDVAKALKSSKYNKSGWEVNLPIQYLPVGETIVKVWVYDKKNQQFIQLNGEPKIKVVEKTINPR